MAKYPELSGKSTLVDGIIGSEAIDTSGEILKIEGVDTSSVDEGLVILNFEHSDPKRPGASFVDVIGKCIYVKKIFDRDDCENDRQLKYWDEVKLPYLYGIFRLFDGSGHESAKAAAAIFRDAVENKEPSVIRYSIEGSTIKRDGNVLEKSIMRAVAATVKPANRSASAGLLYDPENPKGSETKKDDPLSSIKKFEDPSQKILGGGNGGILFDPLIKTITAGGSNAAPSTLTGGAALAREWRGNPSLKARSLAALRDFDGKDKEDLKKFLKSCLPEADDSYIDYFTDLVDDVQVKKSQLIDNLAKKEDGKKPKAPKSGWRFVPAQNRYERTPSRRPKGKDTDPFGKPLVAANYEPPDYSPDHPNVEGVAFGDPSAPVSPIIITDTTDNPYAANRRSSDRGPRPLDPKNIRQLTIRGEPIAANPDLPLMESHIDSKAVLHTPHGSFPLNLMKGKREREEYKNLILSSKDTILGPWTDAMRNWVHLHNLAKSGKLPHEVVAHAAIFSLLSPNTPVPVQELMYSYLVDTMNRTGKTPWSNEWTEDQFADWASHDQPNTIPVHAREHWEGPGRSGIILTADAKDGFNANSGLFTPGRKAGETQRFQIAEDKFKNILKYAGVHPHVLGLLAMHGLDARGATAAAMEWKDQFNRYMNTKAGKEGIPWENSEGTPLPTMQGFKQKTFRYLLGMLGYGNVVVPDTHFIRHVFGLMKGDKKKDGGEYDGGKTGSIETIKNVIWDPRSTGILNSLDAAYHDHPAFELVSKMGDDDVPGFSSVDPEQRLFGAFWLHWLSILPHEKMLGYPVGGENEGTDHAPFWQAIHKILLRHGLEGLPAYKKNEKIELSLKKSLLGEFGKAPLPLRTARAMQDVYDEHGEMAAMHVFHSILAPLLIAHGDLRKSDPNFKVTLVTEALRKSAENELLKPVEPPAIPKGARSFQGKFIVPGQIEFVSGVFKGKRTNVYGRDATHTYIDPPHDPNGEIQKIRNDHEQAVYVTVLPPQPLRVPTVVDANLHAVPSFAPTLSHKLLIHGIDLDAPGDEAPKSTSPGQTPRTAFYTTETGQKVFIKPSLSQRQLEDLLPLGKNFSTARREAVAHHLANALGIGHYVPTTTVFVHPITKEEYSAQAVVSNAHHARDKGAEAMLQKMGDNGTLHKLAIFDHITGNSDRSYTNYLLTPESIQLIDNALSLAYKGNLVPDYLTRYHGARGEPILDEVPANPAAIEFAKNIPTEAIAIRLADHGVPPELIRKAVQRATMVKRVAERPSPTIGELLRPVEEE